MPSTELTRCSFAANRREPVSEQSAPLVSADDRSDPANPSREPSSTPFAGANSDPAGLARRFHDTGISSRAPGSHSGPTTSRAAYRLGADRVLLVVWSRMGPIRSPPMPVRVVARVPIGPEGKGSATSPLGFPCGAGCVVRVWSGHRHGTDSDVSTIRWCSCTVMVWTARVSWCWS